MISGRLTAIVVQRGKLGALVATAGAVASLHLQLVPGGLSKLCQEHVCAHVGAHVLPRPRSCSGLFTRAGLTDRYRGNVPLYGSQRVLLFSRQRTVRLTFRPELQGDGADRTAPVGPALQVEARVAGVDVGEDWLVLVELRL